jgi:hypothetical protein
VALATHARLLIATIGLCVLLFAGNIAAGRLLGGDIGAFLAVSTTYLIVPLGSACVVAMAGISVFRFRRQLSRSALGAYALATAAAVGLLVLVLVGHVWIFDFVVGSFRRSP